MRRRGRAVVGKLDTASRFPAVPLKANAAAGFDLNSSEYRRLEKAVSEGAARFAGIIESAMDAIVSVDEDQRIVLFNASAERMFLCKAADALGRPLDRFLPEHVRVRHRRHVRHFGAKRLTIRRMGHLGSFVGRRSDGSEFPIEASISCVRSGDRRIFTAIVRDVTDRMRAEGELKAARADLERRVAERTSELASANARLRLLLSELSEAEERERRRIAAGLHDEVVQYLFAAKLASAELAGGVKPRRLRAIRTAIDRRVDKAMELLRSLIFELAPPVLQSLGLYAALRHFCGQLEARHGFATSFRNGTALRGLGRELETMLFHALREALRNVARHAAARHVRVSCDRRNGRLCIAVEDDGRGCGPECMRRGPHARGGFGLFAIRENLRRFGGTLDVGPRRPRGTRLVLCVPVPEEGAPS